MNHRKTALTETMAFRLPHDMCERLRNLEGVSMTAYVTAALQAQFRKDDLKAAKAAKQEGQGE